MKTSKLTGLIVAGVVGIAALSAGIVYLAVASRDDSPGHSQPVRTDDEMEQSMRDNCHRMIRKQLRFEPEFTNEIVLPKYAAGDVLISNAFGAKTRVSWMATRDDDLNWNMFYIGGLEIYRGGEEVMEGKILD